MRPQGAAVPDTAAYYSLITFSGCAQGIFQKNCRYPQRDAALPFTRQYAAGNQALPGHTARISVASGRVLPIQIHRQEDPPAPESGEGPGTGQTKGDAPWN